MSGRNIQTVFYKIRCLVSMGCEDPILHKKWADEIEWFYHFERTKSTKYFNLAPEALAQLQWSNLGHTLDNCISDPVVHDWEKRIVDIFLGNDAGADLPDGNESLNNVYGFEKTCPGKQDAGEHECEDAAEIAYVNEQNAYDNYYDEEEERQLAKQECAASRYEERY